MSPRPQKVTDDDIFMAAQRAMSRLGPGELTLADIAREAGVTAGLLVQRFGSKRDLLLTLSERFSGGTSEMFAELRRGHRSPLATLRAYSDCMAHMATARPRSRATSPTCRSISPIPTSGSTWRSTRRRPARAAEAHQGSDRREGAVAGDQCQAAGAHDRSGGRRLDAELGLLSGRHCRKVDASRPRRRPETLHS